MINSVIPSIEEVGNMTTTNICIVKGILRWFELISRLKVNFYKSKLAAIATCEAELRRYTGMLNCRTMNIPFVYLGIQVGVNPRKAATWEWSHLLD